MTNINQCVSPAPIVISPKQGKSAEMLNALLENPKKARTGWK